MQKLIFITMTILALSFNMALASGEVKSHVRITSQPKLVMYNFDANNRALKKILIDANISLSTPEDCSGTAHVIVSAQYGIIYLDTNSEQQSRALAVEETFSIGINATLDITMELNAIANDEPTWKAIGWMLLGNQLYWGVDEDDVSCPQRREKSWMLEQPTQDGDDCGLFGLNCAGQDLTEETTEEDQCHMDCLVAQDEVREECLKKNPGQESKCTIEAIQKSFNPCENSCYEKFKE